MSKIKYLLVTLITIAFCFSVGFAQNTVKPKTSKTPIKQSFKESEFLDLQTKASDRLEGIPFRLTTITERFNGGETTPTKYEKSINEQLPPDRSRFIFEENTPTGIKRKEYITIGDERFKRENNGEWEIFQPSGSGIGSGYGKGMGNEPKIEISEEEYLIAGERLNGKKTDHYRTVRRYTYTYSDRVEKLTITQANWFNQKGLLVKTFEESNDETKKIIERTTNNYEYDVKIKIEKPKVK